MPWVDEGSGGWVDEFGSSWLTEGESGGSGSGGGMTAPSVSFSILDPGLGLTNPATSIPIFLGCCSAGTANVVGSISRISDVPTVLGQGPLAEHVAHALSVAGGPVRYVRLTGSVAGAAGSVTKTAVGSSTGTVTVAGAAYDAYEVIVTIKKTGALGVGEFVFTLDNGRTTSAQRTIPAGGTYAIPNTNLTLTFVPGGGPTIFENGDTHAFMCTAPYYSTTNLATAVTAMLASVVDFDFIVLVGQPAAASGGATMFSALDTHLSTFEAAKRPYRAIMDGAGLDTTTNALSAFASIASKRIMKSYGTDFVASSKPIEGYGTPNMSGVASLAARAAASLISTDLARVASGSLVGVSGISYDEDKQGLLDSAGWATKRTWQGRAGYYITNGNLSSPAGSDFKYWQHGRCMDVACRSVIDDMISISSSGFRTVPDAANPSIGLIDPRDATAYETKFERGLRGKLTEPRNAEGTGGHVSAVGAHVDRTNNALSTSTIQVQVGIRPLGYAKTLIAQLGFTTGNV